MREDAVRRDELALPGREAQPRGVLPVPVSRGNRRPPALDQAEQADGRLPLSQRHLGLLEMEPRHPPIGIPGAMS